MPPQYKDFNKDVKDLLSKNYQTAGNWKLESKFKGADSTLFINPQVEGKVYSVDLEYGVKEFLGTKVKVTCSSSGTFEPKLTLEQKGHKVEFDGVKQVTYEGTSVKDVAATVKLNHHAIELAAAYQCCEPAAVGFSVAVDHKKQSLLAYGAGVRYQHGKNIIFNFTADTQKKYAFGALLGFDALQVKGAKFALQVEQAKELKVHAGVEIPCFLIPGNTYRLKTDLAGHATFAAIRKFGDGWKAALTFNPGHGFGVKAFGAYVVRE